MDVENATQANGTFRMGWTPPIPVATQITLYSILLVWTLLGNVLVIAVVYCNQNLRNNMNYLIVNMAVSDLLVPLVVMPWFISSMKIKLVNSPFAHALCKLVPFLSYTSPCVSSINLVIIAFQRFIAVAYPTRGQIFRSRKSTWIVISFPWIVAMALFSPFFYTFRLTNEKGKTMCYYSWSPTLNEWTAGMIFFSIQAAMTFVIPLMIIIILYAIIVYKLRKSLNNVMTLMEEETMRSRQRRNRRIFSMSITIVVMFTICWCPFQVLNWLLHKEPRLMSTMDFKTLIIIHFAFRYMWFLLAAINPCIYFLFLRDFRQGLKNLCCRKTASTNEPIARRPRTPGEDVDDDEERDGNQDSECAALHINTTSV